MLKIRLRRVGKRNQPSYRVVVVEHTKKIQGSYLEALGTYNPRVRAFAVKQDRVLYWLDHGAQPSERMAKLLASIEMKHKLIRLPDYDRKPKRPPKKATPTTAKTAPTTETSESDDVGETSAKESKSAETPPTDSAGEASSDLSADMAGAPPAPDGSTSEVGASKSKEVPPPEEVGTPTESVGEKSQE